MNKNDIITNLKEDYALLDALKRKNLPVSDELEEQIDDLEQSYISSVLIPEIESYAKGLMKDLRCETFIGITKKTDGEVVVSNEYVQSTPLIENENPQTKVSEPIIERHENDSINILLQKPMDFSLYTAGLTIPLAVWDEVMAHYEGELKIGKASRVTLELDGESYDVRIIQSNQSGGKRVLQILWSVESPIAKHLRKTYPDTYAYIMKWRMENPNRPTPKEFPGNLKLLFTLYSTNKKNVYSASVTLG